MLFFQHFLFKAELLLHQNMTKVANISGKVMETKTQKIKMMNQVIILSVKQRLLII
jgi:hypothetical protein